METVWEAMGPKAGTITMMAPTPNTEEGEGVVAAPTIRKVPTVAVPYTAQVAAAVVPGIPIVAESVAFGVPT
jgi:hypothetical protein